MKNSVEPKSFTSQDFSPTLISRFWSKVLVSTKTECWTWVGAKATGYGTINLSENKRTFKAHRVSWVIHFGTIPDKLCVLHRCDNPECVNPNHLFLGTYADNSTDKCNKGRASWLKHEAHPMAKLDKKSVEKIRSLYSTGNFTHKTLAEMFGVARRTVSHVTCEDNWI
jgi:HNH endonuclease